jgi:O-methyltransferase
MAEPDATNPITDIAAAEALADQCLATVSGHEVQAAFFDRIIAGLLPRSHNRIFWGDRLLTLGKSMGFFDDERFAAAYQTIRGSHQYDQYQSPHTVAWRLHTLVWAAQNALELDGDFVECGVFKGDFSWVVTELTDFARQDRTFYLYDTFAGFAPAYSTPADFPDGPGFLDFAHQVYNDPAIYEEVLRKFGDCANVRIVRGAVPDTLVDTAPARIAFLHIDLNSPAAEIGALEILFDRVVPGAAMVFDDYGWYQFRRQKEAEDAFMAARGYRILELPTGQGLVVKR